MNRVRRRIVLMALTALVCVNPDVYAWKMAKASLVTPWASDVTPDNVWAEYPRPQMVRTEWQNLNGLWQWQKLSSFTANPSTTWKEILVPFCPESPLSGLGSHASTMIYRRTFTLPDSWGGRRLLLNFEAVDWRCEALVDGTSVGTHEGGYDPFTFDITEALTDGHEHELLLRVFDPTDDDAVPRGKQVLNPGGIFYTCTSGIWQTVWLEAVAQTYIADWRVTTDVDGGLATFAVTAAGAAADTPWRIVVRHGEDIVATGEASAAESLTIAIPDAELWTPDHPFLYDVELTLGDDKVTGYFGMRKIALLKKNNKYRLALNNECLFQMGPLDQGFWPDGIYTAPSDEALKNDIVIMKKMGFNMVRKHIKVEPRRWYYWCDLLGLLVWQDMPGENYGGKGGVANNPDYFGRELTALVNTHFNAPSIIMWVIFNEGGGQGDGAYTKQFVDMVRKLDATRLINEASGWNHYGYGDMKDIHPYPAPTYTTTTKKQAMACGEYGGLQYVLKGHLWSSDHWGYASVESPEALDDQYTEYARKLAYFKTFKSLSAAVYTQLTDVEVEVNGLMSYDRVVKSDISRLYAANRLAIECDGQPVPYILNPADEKAETWRYTTNKPADGWQNPDFDFSKWRTGRTGFGANGPSNMNYGTNWTTSDIWIRRDVTLDLSPDELEHLMLRIYNDEDVEVYINGVEAYTATGYLTDYKDVTISEAARAAIHLKGTNVIAAHCHQTNGGQFIDIALFVGSGTPVTRSTQALRAEVCYDRSSELSFLVGWSQDTMAVAPAHTVTYTRLPFAADEASATLGLDDSRLATPRELLFDVSTLLADADVSRPVKVFFQVLTTARGKGSGEVLAARYEDVSSGATLAVPLTPASIALEGGRTSEMMTAVFNPATAVPVNVNVDVPFSVTPKVVLTGQEVFFADDADDASDQRSWMVAGPSSSTLIHGAATAFMPPSAGHYSVTRLAPQAGTQYTLPDAFVVCNDHGGHALSFEEGAALAFAAPVTARSLKFSVEWWMKPDAAGAGFAMYEPSRSGFMTSLSSDGALTITIGGKTVRTPAGSVIPGEWHHYALVYYYSKITLYRDAVQVSQATVANATPAWEGDFCVEGRHAAIDEFRFYNGRLSPSDLRKLAAAPITDVEAARSGSSLAILCRFEEGDDSAVAANDADPDAPGTVSGPARHVSSEGIFCLSFDDDRNPSTGVTADYLTNYKAPFVTTPGTANPFDASRFLLLAQDEETSRWKGNDDLAFSVDVDGGRALYAAAGYQGNVPTLSDSRLWQTVTLPEGVWTLSADVRSNDNAWQSYLVCGAGDALPTLADIAAGHCLAAASLATPVITFILPEEQTVSLGVNLHMPFYSSVLIHSFTLTRCQPTQLEADGRTTVQPLPLTPANTPAEGILYDLQGRRVDTPTAPGIYISEGKKILIR